MHFHRRLSSRQQVSRHTGFRNSCSRRIFLHLISFLTRDFFCPFLDPVNGLPEFSLGSCLSTSPVGRLDFWTPASYAPPARCVVWTWSLVVVSGVWRLLGQDVFVSVVLPTLLCCTLIELALQVDSRCANWRPTVVAAVQGRRQVKKMWDWTHMATQVVIFRENSRVSEWVEFNAPLDTI